MKTIKIIANIELELLQEFMTEENMDLFIKISGKEDTYLFNKPITRKDKLIRESIQKYGMDLMHLESKKATEKLVYKTGGITILPYERTITNGKESIILLNKLMDLLLALIEGDGSVHTRESLKQSISLRKPADDNSLNSYICRLRLELSKLTDVEFIKTYSSNGYKWNFPVEKISVKK